MSEIDLALSALKRSQAELAHSALQTPAGRDAFEYGRVCGIQHGLQLGVEVIDKILSEQSERENQL